MKAYKELVQRAGVLQTEVPEETLKPLLTAPRTSIDTNGRSLVPLQKKRMESNSNRSSVESSNISRPHYKERLDQILKLDIKKATGDSPKPSLTRKSSLASRVGELHKKSKNSMYLDFSPKNPTDRDNLQNDPTEKPSKDYYLSSQRQQRLVNASIPGKSIPLNSRKGSGFLSHSKGSLPKIEPWVKKIQPRQMHSQASLGDDINSNSRAE